MKNICGIYGRGDPLGSQEVVSGERLFEEKTVLRNTIEAVLNQEIPGEDTEITEFLVAMDDGPGLLAAEILLEIKRERPEIRLTCLKRWEDQAADWTGPLRDRWAAVFAACDGEVVLEQDRSPDNREKCRQYMEEHCAGQLLLSGTLPST